MLPFDMGRKTENLRTRRFFHKDCICQTSGTPHPLGKSSTFLGSHFPCEQDRRPIYKFEIETEVLFIYRLIPRKPDFLEQRTNHTFGKSLTFLDLIFLVNAMDNPPSNLT
jgi:hypothetical protein